MVSPNEDTHVARTNVAEGLLILLDRPGVAVTRIEKKQAEAAEDGEGQAGDDRAGQAQEGSGDQTQKGVLPGGVQVDEHGEDHPDGGGPPTGDPEEELELSLVPGPDLVEDLLREPELVETRRAHPERC
jgi:hypothetical protein